MRPREESRWQSDFGRWVDEFEVGRLAQALGVTPQAVYHWVAHRTGPHPDRARAIVGLSRGALTLESIYDPAAGGQRRCA